MKNRKQKLLIHELANEFGFDVCRITDPNLSTITSLRLKEFIELGFHGDMKWLEETYERRKSPIHYGKKLNLLLLLVLTMDLKKIH